MVDAPVGPTGSRGHPGRAGAGTAPDTGPPEWLSYAALAAVVGEHGDRVAEVIGRLHRAVRDEDELVQVLSAATELVHGTSPRLAGATVTLTGDPTLTLASSPPEVADIDKAQYDLGDGPCLRAATTSRSVTLSRAQVRSVWPSVAAVMATHDVAGVTCRPVVLQGAREAAGSVNVYVGDGGSGSTGARTTQQVARGAEAMTDFVLGFVARAVEEYVAVHAARTESRRLREAMVDRAVIEQAKGVLIADHGVDADTAFAALVKMSRDSNVKVRAVAARIIEAATARPGQHASAGALAARGGDGVPAALLATAFRHALVGTAIATPEGTLLASNLAMSEVLGRSGHELDGASLFGFTHPEDLHRAQATCARLQRPDQRRSRVDVRFVRADGSAVRSTVLASKVLAEDGVASHLVMQVWTAAGDPPSSSRRRP